MYCFPHTDELECDLEKLLEHIVAKKLIDKINRNNLAEIINSFVGKEIRFFQILDQMLKRYLDVHCEICRKSLMTLGKTQEMTRIYLMGMCHLQNMWLITKP